MNFTSILERVAISKDFTTQERDFILKAINAAMPPPGTEYQDPGNYIGRIDQIWAYLSVDDRGEGVCAAPQGDMTVPLIAADKRRLDQMTPVARVLAHKFNKVVRLAKFSKREDVEIYRP
jgi:hypothetical protein